VEGSGFVATGYDRSERCYQFENSRGKAGPLLFTLKGSEDRPVQNPAFYIRNWNADAAIILVDGKEWKDGRTGMHQELHGTDLIVFLRMHRDSPVMVSIKPE
jgi:hypothetical protein